MKKIYILLLSLYLVANNALAIDYSVSINGLTYTPSVITIQVGDQVTISASNIHPLVQVDKATWNNDGNSPLSTGWGTKTSDYTFIPAQTDTIYYVCNNHVASGMKGMIIIELVSSMIETNNNFPLKIYPNPVFVGEAVNFLVTTQEYDYYIYSSTGSFVGRIEPTDNTGKFSTHHMSAGSYYIVSRNKFGRHVQKLIVTK